MRNVAAIMGRRQRQGLLLVGLGWLAGWDVLAAGAAPASDEVRIVEAQGIVEVLPAGSVDWVRTQAGQLLRPFARVRTGTNSRAALRWTDQSVVPLNALTEIEILPAHAPGASAGLHLFKGILSFFHRGQPGRIRVLTSGAVAGIEGTEFVIEVAMVDQRERTTVAVIDGRVSLSNEVDAIVVTNLEQAYAELGRAPVRTAGFVVNNILQWAFYYPAVLDLQDLPADQIDKAALRQSFAAYRSGDLLAALALYPSGRGQVSPAEHIYHAALLLSVGQVDEALALLGPPEPPGGASPPESSLRPLANGLRRLMVAVKRQEDPFPAAPRTATELLASSYFEQSRARDEASLRQALELARAATQQSPEFSFAWARVAELEFGFGRTRAAAESLDRSLALAPRNAQALALRGFLLAADDDVGAAVAAFNEAIAVDPALGNAWLGRGLCRIRRRDDAGGREDLLIAAAFEPQRALLRSYLGKAWAEDGDVRRARHELALAKSLDPSDPTAWLYSAVLEEQENRINRSIRELEHSQELNENRRLYRSRLLLDEDRAVRGANLARLYQDANLREVAVREAARAVAADYGNYSAHLFLASSYDALRDPTRFNLRQETVWFNELLLANLLAPLGGTTLSQNLSQQEYSRLFDRDRIGINSDVSYRSDGQYRVLASQYGTVGQLGWALDLDYQHNNGVRPNNELDRLEWYSTFKVQLNPQDSVFLLTKYQQFHSGDNFQYYDPGQASRNFQADETQAPLLLAAFHRQWAPGVHTLFAFARLVNDQQVSDKKVNQVLLATNSAGQATNIYNYIIDPFGVDQGGLDLQYHSQFEIYSFEWNQIFQRAQHTDILGARYQTGDFTTRNLLDNVTPSNPPFTTAFGDPAAKAKITENFDRLSFYGYHTWAPVDMLYLTAGLAYDRMTYPENYRDPPISPGTDRREQLSPKAAIVWHPVPALTLRGAYTKSLGGVSFDESFRLEPTQLAGFSQAYRTVISEGAVGSVSAPRFDTAGGAVDVALPSRTYLGGQVEYIRSQVERTVGAFEFPGIFAAGSVGPTHVRQNLDYNERSALVTANQLLSEEWSSGLAYRFTRSELEFAYHVPSSAARGRQRADLHDSQAFLLLNHPSGFFARWESHWYHQDNSAFPEEDFFQHHVFAGYRFLRRRIELSTGIMNLTDQDYRLNPLNAYQELPRERVFVGRVRVQF
jgi:Tfp pilus assembly protein PilF